MTLFLDALTRSDCELVRRWRNLEENRLHLRTPFVLTEEMQSRFYDDVVCSRTAPHRFWALRDTEGARVQPGGYGDWETRPAFIGMAGLTDIDPTNGHAEISLILDPAKHGKGYGVMAVGLVLAEAFDRMRLESVRAECYETNPALGFWRKMADGHGAHSTTLPLRKFWGGRYHDALLVTFMRAMWSREGAA